MKRNLKEVLEMYLLEKDIYKINNYFANEFCDEFDNENSTIIDYLVENFYDIDIMIHDEKK